MKTKKPLPVLLISILVFVGSIMILIGLLLHNFPPIMNGVTIPGWYLYLTGLFALLYILSTFWLFKMQKRGFDLYVLLTVLADVLGFAIGIWSLSNIIIPILFIVVLAAYYKKMSEPSLFKLKA